MRFCPVRRATCSARTKPRDGGSFGSRGRPHLVYFLACLSLTWLKVDFPRSHQTPRRRGLAEDGPLRSLLVCFSPASGQKDPARSLTCSRGLTARRPGPGGPTPQLCILSPHTWGSELVGVGVLGLHPLTPPGLPVWSPERVSVCTCVRTCVSAYTRVWAWVCTRV